MAAVALTSEGLVVDEAGQVAGGGGRRGSGDGHVVVCAEPTFEAAGTFAHHALERLFLTRIQLAAQAIDETSLGEEKLNAGGTGPSPGNGAIAGYPPTVH